MNKWIALFTAILLLLGYNIQAQQTNQSKDSVLQVASLDRCIQYALLHKPLVQQALLDQQTTEYTIKSKLADWYPQIGFNYSLQHNFQLPTLYTGGNYIQSGALNTSAGQFSVSQNIFNKDALLAKHSATDVRKQSKQSIESNKIEVAVTVSKAFYDVLLTQKQIEIANQTIERLQTSFKNAYNQYKDGIVDKTDYKRASISLNNAKAQMRGQQELLKAKTAYLKNAMGYTAENNFELQYDTLQMEKELVVDTLQSVDYSKRIEYKQLLTQKRLQEYNLQYYKWNYYPTISAYGSYIFNFLNNDFAKLYGTNYPSSFAGIQLSLPLFQGNKRVYQTKSAELSIKRVDWDLMQLRSTINTQYTQALAAYKANLNDYLVLKDNLQLAQEVYNTIQLQYKSGIKNYLEVITAETDLHSSQESYTNALYQVLASKIDVEQALGVVSY